MTPELRFEALPKAQLRVWNKLNTYPSVFKEGGWYLAGGTGLALQLGHRQSFDFDFFSQTKGLSKKVVSWLEAFPKFVLRDVESDAVHAEASGVKLSFIGAYRYPTVEKLRFAENIPLASVVEIALMKLLSITHRAVLRDYIDLAAILDRHSALETLLAQSKRKYGSKFNPLISLRALVSFGDIEGEMPHLLDRSLSRSWQRILRSAAKKLL